MSSSHASSRSPSLAANSRYCDSIIPAPSEDKTVQARILDYTQAISGTYVLRVRPRSGAGSYFEDGVASELDQAGIPKLRIVLVFRPPEVRQHTEYAVA